MEDLVEGEYVLYNGRHVPKEGFRVWIFDSNNEQKLVNSWDEYENYISSGVWFANKQKPKVIEEVKDEVLNKFVEKEVKKLKGAK